MALCLTKRKEERYCLSLSHRLLPQTKAILQRNVENLGKAKEANKHQASKRHPTTTCIIVKQLLAYFPLSRQTKDGSWNLASFFGESVHCYIHTTFNTRNC